MVRVKRDSTGLTLPLRVIPRAKRDEVAGERNDTVCVRLTAAPVDGAANKALIALLAKALGVTRAAVTILSGETSREKRVRIETADADAVAERLRGMGVELTIEH
jgi:uncharacterized protein